MEYTLWEDVGAYLEEHKYAKKYVTPERYVGEHPLEVLTVLPDVENFFGTKVLNIYIVAVPFGWIKSGGTWSESWPPEGYEDAKQRHKDNFEKFVKYETHVYMDYNIVEKVMAASPVSKFREMMDQTKIRMQELCDEMADFGFTMEADITAEVSPDFFYSVIDDFYDQGND